MVLYGPCQQLFLRIFLGYWSRWSAYPRCPNHICSQLLWPRRVKLSIKNGNLKDSHIKQDALPLFL